CWGFFVTEFGASYRLDAPPREDRRYLYTADWGFMKNVTRRDALGVIGSFTAHGADEYTGDFLPHLGGGLSARYRRWLGGRSALDLTVGVPLGSERALG